MTKATVIFGIDDVFPYPEYQKTLNLFFHFLEKHPQLKVTCFTPASYTFKTSDLFSKLCRRLINLDIYRGFADDTFRIDKNKNFTSLVQRFIHNGQLEVASHGFTHTGSPPHFAREFANLLEVEINERLAAIKNIFQKAGFPQPVGFAPPGWGIGKYLPAQLIKNNFKYMAASFDNLTDPSKSSQSHQAGIKNISMLKPEKYQGILNIPRNWDIAQGTIKRACGVIESGGILSIHAHMYPIGVNNEISEKNLTNLERLLNYLTANFKIDYFTFYGTYKTTYEL